MVMFGLGEAAVAVLTALDEACHLAPGADLGALVAAVARALRGGLDLAYVGIAVHVEGAGAVMVRGEGERPVVSTRSRGRRHPAST